MAPTMPIRNYLSNPAVFEPEIVKAMSEALEQVCTELHINGKVHDRETIATRIIDLARSGITDAEALSRRVIAETKALRSL